MGHHGYQNDHHNQNNNNHNYNQNNNHRCGYQQRWRRPHGCLTFLIAILSLSLFIFIII